MTFSPVLILHICGAIVGLLGGWSALVFRKGSRLHRASGNVFFAGMLIMGTTGAYMGFMKQQPSNVIVGTLTCYLVATAWAVIKRKEGETGLFEFGAMLVAFVDGAAALLLGFQVANGGAPFKDGVPPAPYFIFGSVALLCAIWDVRMLIRGGVAGAQRIGRHLWRMGLALFIGTASLFLGKQQHFPQGLVKTHLLNVPVIVVAVVMIFWLVRVRFTNAYKKRPVASSLAKRSVPVGAAS
jgi:uncharacterized membrane protein